MALQASPILFVKKSKEGIRLYYNYKYVDPELKKDNFSTEIAIINTYAVRTLAKRGNCQISAISIRDIIDQYYKEDIEPEVEPLLPPELKGFAKAFSKKDIDTLPSLRGETNYYINLKLDKSLDQIPYLYRMFREELEEVRKQV